MNHWTQRLLAVSALALVFGGFAAEAFATDGTTVCRMVRQRYHCGYGLSSVDTLDHRPGHPRPPGHGGGHPGHGHGPKWCYRWVERCRTSCAPEVETGNIAATTRILGELATKAEFKDAKVYKERVSKIATIEDVQVRFGEYLDLVGLKAATEEELLEFIGAREVDSTRVAIAMEQLQLTSEQGRVLVESLTTALKGNTR